MSNVYKISSTRGIAHSSNYTNAIFSGSSLNRKPIQKIKEAAENNGIQINEFGNYEETNDIINRAFAIDKRQADELPTNRRSLFTPLSVRKLRSLSGRSKDKIRNKIESLYRCSDNANFTFLTLSFINTVTDQNGKKCLNKFLTSCRKKFGNFQYIWIAERQLESTNNIHFHIITNKRFPIDYFNYLWVLQQYNAGIEHEKYTRNEIINYYSINNNLRKELNPFDVKHIRSINSLSIYLTMYVTKNKDTFDCSCWHCSRTIGKLFTTQLCTHEVFMELQTDKNIAVNINTGEVYEAKLCVTDFALIVTVLNKKHFSKYLSELDILNRWIISGFKKSKVPTIDYFDYSEIYLSTKQKKRTQVFQDILKNFSQSSN